MFQDETKIRVAQNCNGYKERKICFDLNSSISLRSCDNCIYFVRKKCTKDLFDQIKATIILN